MKYYLLSREVKEILENITGLRREDFMNSKLYEELFSIKSKIQRSEAKFKLLDRAKDVGVKTIADEFIAEFQRDEKKKEKEERESRSLTLVENVTNFYPDRSEKGYPC